MSRVSLGRPEDSPRTSTVRTMPEGTVRVSPVTAVPDVLRDLGADPAEIFARAGVAPGLLDDPENVIGFAALGHLLSVCAEETRCAHFGLLVGQQAGLSSLGLLGFLAQHSPSVGAALRDLIRHLRIHDRGAVPTLSAQGGVAALGYAIYQPDVEGIQQIYDGAVAIILNIMRGLCGPTWRPTEVLFAHRPPSDPGPYLRLFQAPVRFNAEQSALVFPAAWLKQPRPGADPALRRLLEEQVEAIEGRSRGDFVGQVSRLLRATVPAGQYSMARVAELLSMHRRTLNRRLDACGTTFQTLVEEVRFGIARQLLEDTDLPLSQVAATVGYSDVSAFTRAFRRWSGTSPGAWRRTRAARR